MQVDTILSLSVETSGRIGSVALARGPRIIEAVEFSAAQRHAVELLPTADALCRRHRVQPSQIDEIYVSVGPGSFTGLRLGVTFAKTLAAAGRARLVAVPSLEVIAQNVLALPDPPAHLAVLLDAKRGHVYAAGFEWVRGDQASEAAYRSTANAIETDPGEFLARMPRDAAVLGEGVAYHEEAIRASRLRVMPPEFHRPRAECVFGLGWQSARAGRFDDAIRLIPTYVRRPEAEEVYDRRHPA